MEKILFEAQRLHIWRPLDIQFARILAISDQPALMLVSAWLSFDTSNGHVCLPLSLLTMERLFDGQVPLLAEQAWLRAGSPSHRDWQQYLLTSPAVSDGSRPTPLVFDKQRLYLQRMWQYECIVAKFFGTFRPMISYNQNRIFSLLEHYFPTYSNTIDWQKVAVAIAITHPIAIISGGPGTGKTFTAAKLLVILLDLYNKQCLRILMAAPTGKAAARLKESMNTALQNLGINKKEKQWLPLEVMTIHRLLGARSYSQKFQHNHDNPIHADILIIDEASMIDLSMMADIIMALPPKIQVIFLGDRFQLPSVETGAIFGDICQFAKTGYSAECCTILKGLIGLEFTSTPGANKGRIADSICILRKSYRFHGNSNIGYLASAINIGNTNGALELLNNDAISDIKYLSLHGAIEYQRMISNCVDSYQDYLQRVQNNDAPYNILRAFNNFRLLCALREGLFGVSKLNTYIEHILMRVGLLTRGNLAIYYSGRPIVIIHNAPLLGLYNGDIGIFLKRNEVLRVYFLMPDNTIKIVPLSRLPRHETAFAMTVHKSQGSEFEHTALVLPNYITPVLTRELIYVAVTRARTQLSIYATDEVLKYAIANRTNRRSGVAERIIDNTI